jgi:hypothetical protein
VDEKFTPEEIAESLRVCADPDKPCSECQMNSKLGCSQDVKIVGAEAIEAQAERIRELEAELAKLREERRWIPTSERLPDQELEAEPKDADGKPLLGGYECIAQIEGAKRPTALWYCRIDGEGVWTDESGENFYPVTHWKPMPKGPEAE